MPKPFYTNVYVVLVFIQTLFGLNFVASKIIVGDMDPVHWAAVRFFVAGLVMLVYCLTTKRPRSGQSLHYFKNITIFSFFGLFIGQVAMLKGVQLTTSINTSLLTSTIPIWTLIIVSLAKIEPFSLRKGLGFIIAFIGVASIRDISQIHFSDSTLVGDLLVLLGATGTATYFAFSRNFLRQHNHFWLTTWMFLFAGAEATLLALIEGNPLIIPQITSENFIAIIFSIVGATLLTYFLSNWALTKINSGKLSLFIYLQPLVTSVVAWYYLGEAITLRTIVSAIFILIGFSLGMGPTRKTSLKEFPPKDHRS